MYKLKLNTDTTWVPQYTELDEYLRDNGNGVRASTLPLKEQTSAGAHACACLLGDSGFSMFHKNLVNTAALHGYLQNSKAHDLLQVICKCVTVVEQPDSDDEDDGQSKHP